MGIRRSTVARRQRHGAAMVATVALIAMMLSLSTAALLMSTSDVRLFRNLRDGTATYYTTRGAGVRAAARLPAGYAFDAALAGPDGSPGTGDDGSLAGPPQCTLRLADDAADPEPPPYRDGNQRARVLAGCTGHRSTRRDVEIIIGRDVAPFVPGALYLRRPEVDIAAPMLVDGRDHAPGDRPGSPTGPAAAVADAASSDLDAPVSLGPSVHNGGGERVEMRPTVDLDAPALETRALALGLPLIPVLPAGALPGLVSHTAAGADVAHPTRGRGLLLIDGDLRIDAPLDFSGVIIISGRLRIGPTGTLSLRGSLWVRGAGPGPTITAAGPATVLYSSEAVARADAALTLPRRAVALSERQVF